MTSMWRLCWYNACSSCKEEEERLNRNINYLHIIVPRYNKIRGRNLKYGFKFQKNFVSYFYLSQIFSHTSRSMEEKHAEFENSCQSIQADLREFQFGKDPKCWKYCSSFSSYWVPPHASVPLQTTIASSVHQLKAPTLRVNTTTTIKTKTKAKTSLYCFNVR